ncbi:MAG: hypothetical protein AAGN82_21240 [Myxococcota bacterium]
MSFWREPELPPVQRMPAKRPPSRARRGLGRAVALVAGLALLVTGGLGVYRSLTEKGPGGGGGGDSVMSLAVLLPASVLLRFAVTGQIRSHS